MSVVTGITPNRAILLYHLRINPNSVEQIFGALKDSYGHMCAVGLGCDALEIPMRNNEVSAAGFNPLTYSPYIKLAEKLDISTDDVVGLYTLNDFHHLTFAKVAKVAEAFFNSDQTTSVLDTYKRLTDEGEL